MNPLKIFIILKTSFITTTVKKLTLISVQDKNIHSYIFMLFFLPPLRKKNHRVTFIKCRFVRTTNIVKINVTTIRKRAKRRSIISSIIY